MFTSKAFYPRVLLLGTSFALLGVPSRTARTFLPFCRAHDDIFTPYSTQIKSLAPTFFFSPPLPYSSLLFAHPLFCLPPRLALHHPFALPPIPASPRVQFISLKISSPIPNLPALNPNLCPLHHVLKFNVLSHIPISYQR